MVLAVKHTPAREAKQPKLQRAAQGQQKQLQRLTGRHVFIQDLFAQMQSLQGLASHSTLTSASRQSLMSQSTRLYKQLLPREQARYEERAGAQVQARALQSRDEAEAATSALALLRQREQQQRQVDGVRNILSEIVLSDADLKELQSHVQLSPMPVSAAKTWLDIRLQSPTALNPLQEELFKRHLHSLCRPDKDNRPPWIKGVCAHRDRFRGAVFQVAGEAMEPKHFLFLFAKQNPREVGYVQVQPVPFVPGSCSQGLPRLDGEALSASMLFEVTKPLSFVAATTKHFPQNSDIEVFPDTWFSNGNQLVALRESQCLTSFLDDLGEVVPPCHQTCSKN